MADKARHYALSCDKCDDVTIVVKAVDHTPSQTTAVPQQPTAVHQQPTASPTVDQDKAIPQTYPKTEDNSQTPAAPRKVTKKYKNKGNESNAKLVWWGLSGRKQYILREGKNYIGRKDDDMPSDLSLKDEFASARSVCIEVTKRDKGYVFHLTVERASNPVLVCGKNCPVGTSFDLNYNDTVRLGNTTLTLKPAKK